jgi:hypothetical protein
MQSNLSRAWDTLSRFPVLMLIPLLWDVLNYLAVAGLGLATVQPPGRSVQFKFLFPSSLPTGAGLIGGDAQINLMPGTLPPISTLLDLIVTIVVTALLGAFITGGFLHLLTEAVRGAAPSWEGFGEGVGRFGPRILLLHLAVVGIGLVALLIAWITGFGILILILFGLTALIVGVVYSLTTFLMVVEDLSLREALSVAPSRLGDHFRALVPVVLISLVLSALFSATLTSLGLRTIFLAGPLWAWFGTWISLAVITEVLPPPADELSDVIN